MTSKNCWRLSAASGFSPIRGTAIPAAVGLEQAVEILQVDLLGERRFEDRVRCLRRIASTILC